MYGSWRPPPSFELEVRTTGPAIQLTCCLEAAPDLPRNEQMCLCPHSCTLSVCLHAMPVTSDRISVALSSRPGSMCSQHQSLRACYYPLMGVASPSQDPGSTIAVPVPIPPPHAWATTRGNRKCPRVAELPVICSSTLPCAFEVTGLTGRFLEIFPTTLNDGRQRTQAWSEVRSVYEVGGGGSGLVVKGRA